MTALVVSSDLSAVNFVFAIPAVWLIDSFGRRSLLLSTFPFMTIFLLCTGLSFLAPVEGDIRLALTATFIYLFTAFYSVGEGPVGKRIDKSTMPYVRGTKAVFVRSFCLLG